MAINHYLEGADDVILADPETGACPSEEVAEDHTHPLLIMVRNCDSELIVFFTKPQEGCVPGDGAFFNVTSDSGEFLGNCEASINASNPAALYAGCVVQVPYGSTRPYYAPPNSEPVDGEDYGPIFINVLQTGEGDGSIPTDLPNTGAGLASNGSEGGMIAILLGSVAALLGLAGLRLRYRA